MKINTTIKIISAVSILAASLFLSSCGKGFNEKALNGSWEDGDTVITFNTKDKTASLTAYDQTATGTYEISTWDKMNAVITKYCEGGQDYTAEYSDGQEVPLASVHIKDGELTMGNFFQSKIVLKGGTGETIDTLAGEWSFEEDGAKLVAVFDSENKTFSFKEYFFLSQEEVEQFSAYYGFAPAADGLIMEMEGTYKTESFTNITVSLELDGQVIDQDGELTLADDKNSITISGQTFTKQKKGKKAEAVSDELTPELPADGAEGADAGDGAGYEIDEEMLQEILNSMQVEGTGEAIPEAAE